MKVMPKSNILLPSILTLAVSIIRHTGRRRQYQIMLAMMMMIVCALVEISSLSLVLPFLSALTMPEKLLSYPLVAEIANFFDIRLGDDLILALTSAFVFFMLFAGGARLLMMWTSIRLSYAIGADFSNEVYRRTLYQPYHVHLARNSSEIISGITLKVSSTMNVVLCLLGMVSSLVLSTAIMLVMFTINPVLASVSMICFGAIYGLITWLFRLPLYRNSRRIALMQTQVVKALQEGLGGIRDVLLGGTQSVYCDTYHKADKSLRKAQGTNYFIETSPRYIIEALAMTLVAMLAYSMSRQSGGINAALPMLGAMTLGAQRLIPLLQQLYAYWTLMAGNRAAVTDVLELLDQPIPVFELQPAPLILKNEIRFDAVRFRYSNDTPWILDGFNLTIQKGARVGIVGSTGSGKSTTLDLLMLLLEPNHGSILVDGHPITTERRHAWQQTISHVPQSIYLADTSFLENIAFGVPPEKIDLHRVRQAAHYAQIADFIESHSDGYDAFVGERGIRLSGGQRQRVGIARALYKQATIMVFDEATSSLDNDTEQAVMDAIKNLNREITIIIIAHRLTTVQHCDTIVQLDFGRLVEQGTYEELLMKSPSFRRMTMAP